MVANIWYKAFRYTFEYVRVKYSKAVVSFFLEYVIMVWLEELFHIAVSLCQCFLFTNAESFTKLNTPPLFSPDSIYVLASCSVAIGFGFYGNSEANDGMYQLTSSLLTANHTLASIDMLVRKHSV